MSAPVPTRGRPTCSPNVARLKSESQPRSLRPNRWAIPLALADVGLMSSGGMAGLVIRPKRAEEGASG